MYKYAVIVAGGMGTRMGSALPKQFLPVHQKPILWYTLNSFVKSFRDIRIILVLPSEYLDAGRSVAEEFHSGHLLEIIQGGHTRFHSVQAGLSLVHEESVVFIHDAVRCFLQPSLIHHCYEEARVHGSAIPCVEPQDSIRILEGDGSRSVKRTGVRLVQTPQTFLSRIILPAYQQDFRDEFTDDASVAEASGNRIHLVEGDPGNIKVTTPVDLSLAAELLTPPHTS